MAQRRSTGTGIDPARRLKYIRARDQGESKSVAARLAGISRETAYGIEDALDRERQRREQAAGKRGKAISASTMASGRAGHGNPWANGYTSALGQEDLPDPKLRSELTAEAERALEDFGHFRARYFGRARSPWQEQAGVRMLELLESPEKAFVVVNTAPGGGKALALDTPLPTPSGWTTMKDVRIGDELFDETGQPCRVIFKSEVFYGHDCYEVRTDDGASVVADAEHQWVVRLGNHRALPDRAGKTGPKSQFGDGRTVHTTEDLARRRSKRPQLQMPDPLVLPDIALPIDPYVLGIWLGDGSSTSGCIFKGPADAAWLREEIERCGFVTTECADPLGFRVLGPSGRRWTRDGLTSLLRAEGLLRDKHIPEVYFRASPAQRLALLQGLIDTDGYVGPSGHVEFSSTSPRLAYGVQALVRSLGVKASLAEGRATLYGRDCGPKYRVTFYMAGAARLPRKAAYCRDAVRTPHRYLTVTPTESVPTQCIQVDSPSHLFLAGEGLMVTHNTTLFCHDLVCWLIARNRSVRIMLGSRTYNQAARYSGRVRRSLQQRVLPIPPDDQLRKGLAVMPEATLIEDFGRFRPDDRISGDVWQRGGFIVAQPGDLLVSEKEPTVAAFGFDGDVLGTRIDVAIWDDLVDYKNTRTADQRDELIQSWEMVAEKRLEPGGLLILQGQRLAANDFYRYCLDQRVPALDEDGEPLLDERGEPLPPKARYVHIVYPAHDEARCRGQHGLRAPAWNGTDEGGCLLDPQRLAWKDLAGEEARHPDKYRVLFQQEDVDPHSQLVPSIWIHGGRDPDTGEEFPGCLDKDRRLCQVPKGLSPPLHSYATLDPAQGAGFWAWQWWMFHPESERRYLLDLARLHLQAPDLLDWNPEQDRFTGMMEEWQARSVERGLPIRHWIVEQNSAQRFLFQYAHVRRWTTLNSVTVVPHQTSRNKTDEDRGVETIKNQYRFGRVRLPWATPEAKAQVNLLIKEVTLWPDGATDDQVMAQWIGEWHLPRLFPPRKKIVHTQRRPSWLRTASSRRGLYVA